MNEEKVEEGWSDKYKKSIDCNNPKGFSQKAHCQGKKKKMNEDKQIKKIVKQLRKSVKSHAKQADTLEKKITEGSLHKWFKGSKSKDGKGGWVNVVTGGTCASDEPGEGTPKCVSSAKRASMSKKEMNPSSQMVFDMAKIFLDIQTSSFESGMKHAKEDAEQPGLALQDHGEAGHRREALAPGRALLDPNQQGFARLPHLDRADGRR